MSERAERPRFSGEINLGHLLQAIVVIVMIEVAVLPAYNTLTNRQAMLETKVSDLVTAMSAQAAAENLRLTSDEARMDKADQASDAFRAEQRAAMNKLLDSIATLRESMASGKPHGR